jgi:hypothetical protein
MQAIETKYLCPTNCRASRIVATCEAKRKIFSYSSLVTAFRNQNTANDIHQMAAILLAEELDWLDGYHLVSGTIKNGNDVHVLVKDNG